MMIRFADSGMLLLMFPDDPEVWQRLQDPGHHGRGRAGRRDRHTRQHWYSIVINIQACTVRNFLADFALCN